jgi:hypothetical protein
VFAVHNQMMSRTCKFLRRFPLINDGSCRKGDGEADFNQSMDDALPLINCAKVCERLLTFQQRQQLIFFAWFQIMAIRMSLAGHLNKFLGNQEVTPINLVSASMIFPALWPFP